jgi:serine/threonine protein kinase
MSPVEPVFEGRPFSTSTSIVHRDLKPGNCLMTSDGALKITDFGLVKDDAWPSLEKNHLLCPRNSTGLGNAGKIG